MRVALGSLILGKDPLACQLLLHSVLWSRRELDGLVLVLVAVADDAGLNSILRISSYVLFVRGRMGFLDQVWGWDLWWKRWNVSG